MIRLYTHNNNIGGLGPKPPHKYLWFGSTTQQHIVVWAPSHHTNSCGLAPKHHNTCPKPPHTQWWFGFQTTTHIVAGSSSVGSGLRFGLAFALAHRIGIGLCRRRAAARALSTNCVHRTSLRVRTARQARLPSASACTQYVRLIRQQGTRHPSWHKLNLPLLLCSHVRGHQ